MRSTRRMTGTAALLGFALQAGTAGAEQRTGLGRHLQSSVRTGTFCVYDPGPESAGASRVRLAA